MAITKLVEAVVRKNGLEDRFILQSADYRTIDAMHEINPRIRTCLLSPWRFSTNYLALARQHHAVCILLRAKDTNAAQVQQLRDAGILVFSDVVDDEAGWRAYLALGMSAIFSNDPASLLAFLKREGARN
jgi:glycerophosphoryl diester phosphodiesterase